MTELEQAVLLANKVLDRVNADPDDDLAILARQFLRARERIGALERQDVTKEAAIVYDAY
jgi:hypothetical protein